MKSFGFWAQEGQNKTLPIELTMPAGTKTGRLYITPKGGAEALITGGVTSVTDTTATLYIPSTYITAAQFPATFRLQINVNAGAFSDYATGKGTIYYPVGYGGGGADTHTNRAILDAITASYVVAEQTKLAGIATGATANDTDANLKNRANHSGSQLASTISDFASAADARIVIERTAAATYTNKTLTSPAITGTPTGITKTHVGLANVDNTADTAKPVSTAQQTALDAKSDKTKTVNAQTGTAYTLAAVDAAAFVTMTNAAASTLTVPPNSSVPFAIGTVIEGAQLGAGQVTITPGAAVTIVATPGLKVAVQYGTFGLLKTGTDTWLAMGRLST